MSFHCNSVPFHVVLSTHGFLCSFITCYYVCLLHVIPNHFASLYVFRCHSAPFCVPYVRMSFCAIPCCSMLRCCSMLFFALSCHSLPYYFLCMSFCTIVSFHVVEPFMAFCLWHSNVVVCHCVSLHRQSEGYGCLGSCCVPTFCVGGKSPPCHGHHRWACGS